MESAAEEAAHSFAMAAQRQFPQPPMPLQIIHHHHYYFGNEAPQRPVVAEPKEQGGETSPMEPKTSTPKRVPSDQTNMSSSNSSSSNSNNINIINASSRSTDAIPAELASPAPTTPKQPEMSPLGKVALEDLPDLALANSDLLRDQRLRHSAVKLEAKGAHGRSRPLMPSRPSLWSMSIPALQSQWNQGKGGVKCATTPGGAHDFVLPSIGLSAVLSASALSSSPTASVEDSAPSASPNPAKLPLSGIPLKGLYDLDQIAAKYKIEPRLLPYLKSYLPLTQAYIDREKQKEEQKRMASYVPPPSIPDSVDNGDRHRFTIPKGRRRSPGRGRPSRRFRAPTESQPIADDDIRRLSPIHIHTSSRLEPSSLLSSPHDSLSFPSSRGITDDDDHIHHYAPLQLLAPRAIEESLDVSMTDSLGDDTSNDDDTELSGISLSPAPLELQPPSHNRSVDNLSPQLTPRSSSRDTSFDRTLSGHVSDHLSSQSHLDSDISFGSWRASPIHMMGTSPRRREDNNDSEGNGNDEDLLTLLPSPRTPGALGDGADSSSTSPLERTPSSGPKHHEEQNQSISITPSISCPSPPSPIRVPEDVPVLSAGSHATAAISSTPSQPTVLPSSTTPSTTLPTTSISTALVTNLESTPATLTPQRYSPRPTVSSSEDVVPRVTLPSASKSSTSSSPSSAPSATPSTNDSVELKGPAAEVVSRVAIAHAAMSVKRDVRKGRSREEILEHARQIAQAHKARQLSEIRRAPEPSPSPTPRPSTHLPNPTPHPVPQTSSSLSTPSRALTSEDRQRRRETLERALSGCAEREDPSLLVNRVRAALRDLGITQHLPHPTHLSHSTSVTSSGQLIAPNTSVSEIADGQDGPVTLSSNEALLVTRMERFASQVYEQRLHTMSRLTSLASPSSDDQHDG